MNLSVNMETVKQLGLNVQSQASEIRIRQKSQRTCSGRDRSAVSDRFIERRVSLTAQLQFGGRIPR